MRLIGISGAVLIVAGGAQAATAQGSWTPQAAPSPSPPPPVYVSPPAPPAPRQTKERAARPKGNPGAWVTSDDYPAEAMRAEEQGTTAFRLTIDATGAVTACDIISSSGSQSLDEATCRIMMERGTFTPALDKKGKPTTGTWVSRFKWVIPEPEIMATPVPFTQIISFIIETDGSLSDCSIFDPVTKASRSEPCGSGPAYEPFRDAAGNPVRRRVTQKVEQTVTDPDAPQPPPPAPAPAPTPTPKKKRAKP